MVSSQLMSINFLHLCMPSCHWINKSMKNRKTIKEILCMDPYQHKVLLQLLLHALLTLVFNFYNNFFIRLCRICVSLARHLLLTMISSMDGGAKHAQNALKHYLDLQTTSDALNMGFQNLHQFHGEKD